ncbi:hypothetical protein D4764_03G0006840, partial [Takifugu flavidus]
RFWFPSSLWTHGSPGSLVALPPAVSAAAAAASGSYVCSSPDNKHRGLAPCCLSTRDHIT